MWHTRPETPGDHAAVREVHLRAFAPSTYEADLVDRLRARGDLAGDLCLVAEREHVIAGHIAFSHALIGTRPVLALAPMAVLPEHQRTGAGSALVRAALAGVHDAGFTLVVVLGHPGYYPRFGFEPAEPLGIRAPFDVDPGAWMAYRTAGHRPVAGTVTYSSAF